MVYSLVNYVKSILGDFTNRTRVLSVEHRHWPLETVGSHRDVCDLKMVLQKSAHKSIAQILPQELTFLTTPVVGHSISMSVSMLKLSFQHDLAAGPWLQLVGYSSSRLATALATEPEKRPLSFQGTSRCAPGSAHIDEGKKAKRAVALTVVESIMKLLGVLKERKSATDGANYTCKANVTISNTKK